MWAREGRTLYSFTPHCPPNSRTSWNFRDCHITKPIIRPSATHMKWFFGPVQNNFLYLMAHYYCLLHIFCIKMLKWTIFGKRLLEMKSKYRFWDSVSRAGVGLTLVFITRIMRGQAWMHIGVPVACFSSGPHQLSSGFSYWPWYSPDLPYLNLLFLHLDPIQHHSGSACFTLH